VLEALRGEFGHGWIATSGAALLVRELALQLARRLVVADCLGEFATL